MATRTAPLRRGRSGATRRWLGVALWCGCVAPIVAVGTDLAAIALWRGYDPVFGSASDLTAVGAPTRLYVLAGLLASDVLIVLFGLGVLGVAAGDRALRVIGGLLVANGLLSLLATIAWPGRLGEPEQRSLVSVTVAAAALLCLLAAIGTGAFARRGWFRYYSLGIVLLFGALTVLGVVAQSSPHIGLQERVMAYVSSSWVLVLAATLVRRHEANRRCA